MSFRFFFSTQRHRRRPMVFYDTRGTSAWTTSSLFSWGTTRTLNHLQAVAASSPIFTRRSTPGKITDNGYWRTSKYVVIRLMTDCDWLINLSIVWLTAWITDHLIYWRLTDWLLSDNWMTWLIKLLTSLLRDWLTDWLTDRLFDRTGRFDFDLQSSSGRLKGLILRWT